MTILKRVLALNLLAFAVFTSCEKNETDATANSQEFLELDSTITCAPSFSNALSRQIGNFSNNVFQIDLQSVGENPSYEYFIDGEEMIHVGGNTSRTVSFRVNTTTGAISRNSFRSTLTSLSAGEHEILIRVNSDSCDGGEVSYPFSI